MFKLCMRLAPCDNFAAECRGTAASSDESLDCRVGVGFSEADGGFSEAGSGFKFSESNG